MPTYIRGLPRRPAPTLKEDFLSDFLRKSPQKLDKVERQEVERKPESSPFNRL
jgi:hypothetical protein